MAEIGGKWCFCTLALGERYCQLARQLAGDIALHSPATPFLVLTDLPEALEGPRNIVAVPHRKRSVKGYNDKLCVIAKALQMYDTCVFLDADTRIVGQVNNSQDMFRPGIQAAIVRTWEYTRNEATSPNPKKWQSDNIRIMGLLREAFGLQESDPDIPYVVEYLFAVTRNEKLEAFLKQWAVYAEFCEKNRLFIHEGFSIGLAALKTGFGLEESDFRWLRLFEPLIAGREVRKGVFPQDEYDTLNATITRYKNPPAAMRWGWRVHQFGQMLDTLRVQMRYLRVRLFGLRLLD